MTKKTAVGIQLPTVTHISESLSDVRELG